MALDFEDLLPIAANDNSARTRLAYPDGAYIGYTLDALNRVSGEGYISNSGLFTQTYDNLGRLTAISKGAGGSTNFSYDGVGRLVSQTNDLPGTVNDVTYGFTAYNPANQIMGISINNNAYEFQQSAAISNSKSFDGLNHIVGFGYDARSNLTSDGVRNFAFDILNRMTSFSGGGNNGTMTYDPEGRLVSQIINGVMTSFLYDGTEMIAEYNSAGTVLRKYVHSTRDDDPQVWLEGAGNSDIRYVYANYQGSVVATTNATGSTVQLYKYDPYGIPKDASNNDSWQGFRFRYTGQQIIPEAKLYYYKARVYDPDLGTFLQTDPIGTKDDLNLYAYVGEDPINKVDPDGMEKKCKTTTYFCRRNSEFEDLSKLRAQQKEFNDYKNQISNENGIWLGKAIAAELVSAATLEIGRAVVYSFLSREALRVGGSIIIDSKIFTQMSKRGWSVDDVQRTIADPLKTSKAIDSRHISTGGKLNEPATIYFSRDGGYVITNNKTGEIVQISNRNKTDWKSPW